MTRSLSQSAPCSSFCRFNLQVSIHSGKCTSQCVRVCVRAHVCLIDSPTGRPVGCRVARLALRQTSHAPLLFPTQSPHLIHHPSTLCLISFTATVFTFKVSSLHSPCTPLSSCSSGTLPVLPTLSPPPFVLPSFPSCYLLVPLAIKH